MKIAIPSEARNGERLVALVPKDIAALKKQKVEIHVEAGAGSEAFIPDADFGDAGAMLGSRQQVLADADLILTVHRHLR